MHYGASVSNHALCLRVRSFTHYSITLLHTYAQRRCYSVRLSFTVTHLLFVMLLKLVLSEVNQVVTLLALMVTVLLSFSDNL